jgi:hypothetical protein
MEPIMSTNTKHTPHYLARSFQKQKTNKKKTKKYLFINSCWLQFYLVFWLLFSLVVVEGGKLSDGILVPGRGEQAPTLIPWLC